MIVIYTKSSNLAPKATGLFFPANSTPIILFDTHSVKLLQRNSIACFQMKFKPSTPVFLISILMALPPLFLNSMTSFFVFLIIHLLTILTPRTIPIFLNPIPIEFFGEFLRPTFRTYFIPH